MVRELAAACLCLVPAISMVAGASEEPAPKLPSREKVLIGEAYHLWSAVADEVWPGAATVKAPLVYIQEQHEYAIGFERTLDGFTDTGESLLGKPVRVRLRTLAPDLSASFPVQGIPAAVMGSPEALGKSPAGWVLTVSHEMFHVFQAANGSYRKASELQLGQPGESSWHLAFPFPYTDANVMRLIHLQGYLAWLAAESANPEDTKYNIGTALDAVHVYRAYLAQIGGGDNAYRYSQYQEWNEGVAAYFEYRLARQAADGAYQPTRDYSSLPLFQRYDDLWREAYEARPFLSKHAGRAAKSRLAFYHLGAGKALALDKLDPTWKKRYVLPGIWLDDLLAPATGETNN